MQDKHSKKTAANNKLNFFMPKNKLKLLLKNTLKMKCYNIKLLSQLINDVVMYFQCYLNPVAANTNAMSKAYDGTITTKELPLVLYH